jgi:hypothetical protein
MNTISSQLQLFLTAYWVHGLIFLAMATLMVSAYKYATTYDASAVSWRLIGSLPVAVLLAIAVFLALS